jgi:hypothetical protein
VGATTADEGLGFLAYLRDPSHRGQNGDTVRSRAKGRQQRNMARTPFVAIASWGRERSVTRYEKRNKKIAVTSYPPRGRQRGLLGLPANERGGVVCRASCVVRRVSCVVRRASCVECLANPTAGHDGKERRARPHTPANSAWERADVSWRPKRGRTPRRSHARGKGVYWRGDLGWGHARSPGGHQRRHRWAWSLQVSPIYEESHLS